MMSSFEELALENTFRFSKNRTSFCIFPSAAFFPMPNGRDVVSQPSMLWMNRTLSHTISPSSDLAAAISLILGDFSDCLRAYGLKNILYWMSTAWYSSKTRRSVSSPMSTVSCLAADEIAVWTIRRSASPCAWCTSHPVCSSFSASMLMKRCLFTLFERNYSFLIWRVSWLEQWTVTPTEPLFF